MQQINCPSCDKPNDETAQACRYCGQELDALPPPPPPKKEMGDGAKYGIIIGVVVVAAIILIAISSNMWTPDNCKKCKGKCVVTCEECKGGKPKCRACNGTGQDKQNWSSCSVCDGGKKPPPNCWKCKGEGKYKCTYCGGTGKKPG